MKKNFLKKLASVLSLALVVSSITPAASASAAAAPNLAKRYTNVYEGTSYAYTVKAAAGHTVKWTVTGAGAEYVNLSKKTGASTKLTVDTDGETAAKNKNVTVKASFYKGGKLVKSAGDVVKVKVSAKDLAIVAADTDLDLTAIAAGEVVDFNRGITPKNATSVTYWSVTDKDGNATTDATIDGTGNFKADKVGEYVVKAVARNAKNGKDIVTAEQAVKVVLAIKDVKQLSINKLEVTFGADASKLVTKSNIAVETKDTKANSYVKEVSFSTDGKTATVEVYNNFVDKKEYTVTYDKKAVGFIASVGEVAQVVIKDKVVKYADPTALDITLLDANGINVTTDAEINGKVTAKTTNNVGWVDYPANGKINVTLYNIGDVSTVTATYATGKYDTAGKSIDVVSNVATITAVKDLAVEGNLQDFTAVRNAGNPDWTKTVKKIAKDDSGKLYIKGRVDGTDFDSNLVNGVEFESSNANILLVNTDGTYIAVAEGTAYVTAKYNNYTAVFAIEVGAARKEAAISVDKPSYTLSNKFDTDSITVKATVKDQYGDDMGAKALEVDQLSGPKAAGVEKILSTSLPKDGEVKFEAGTSATAGTYQFKVTHRGLSVRVDVTVRDNGTSDIASYRLEQSNSDFDLKADADTKTAANVITVAKYNRENTKLGYDTTATTTITVTGPNDFKKVGIDGTVSIDLITVADNKIVKNADTGTYNVKVEVLENGVVKVKQTTTFTVKDTQALPSVKLDTIKATNLEVASGNSILLALIDAKAITAVLGRDKFENNATDPLQLIGIDCTSANGVVAADGTVTTTVKGTYRVFLKSVTLQGEIAGNTIEYVVNQGHNITIVVQ